MMSRAELVPPGAEPSRRVRAHSRREREHSLTHRAGTLLAGLLLSAAASSAASAKDLVGVYEDALRNDPTIRAADANRLASRESRPQALAALLPQITGSGAYTRDHSSGFQDNPNAITQPGPTPGTTIVTGFVVAPVITSAGSTQRQWGLNLRENLFSWSNWVTLKQANAQVAQAEATYLAAEQNLILRVSQAYFNVLSALDNLQAQESSLEAIARQLDQADKRYDVGLIAITDVQEAKAARDNASAAVIAAKRTLATAEDQLEEITGEKYDSLTKPGDDMPLNTPEPADEGKWVNISLEQNATLIAARLNADVARDAVQVAFGGHLPTVSIVAGRTFTEQSGPYSFGGPGQPTTSLNGFGNKFNDRQISLQVSVPIFSGGETQSRVRQSQYLWIAAKEQMTQTSRATQRQARDAYLGVISGIARVQALRQALESSQTALKATEAGYEVGTRTAVDVLNARRTLVQAQTDYSGSRYDFIISIVQLRLAAGNLDRPQLEQINSWLGVGAPTSPRVETPEGLTPKLPPATITAPVTPKSVLPPPSTQQPPGRQPRNP